MLILKKIRCKNFLSYGENPVEFIIDKSNSTLINGKNGEGKCVKKLTRIDLQFDNDEVESKFLEFLKRKNDENYTSLRYSTECCPLFNEWMCNVTATNQCKNESKRFCKSRSQREANHFCLHAKYQWNRHYARA